MTETVLDRGAAASVTSGRFCGAIPTGAPLWVAATFAPAAEKGEPGESTAATASAMARHAATTAAMTMLRRLRCLM